MTWLLGIILGGIGPVGVVLVLIAAVVAARLYLGKAGAIAIGALVYLAVAYVVGSHQATVAAEAAALRTDRDVAVATLEAERVQAAKAASISRADRIRADAAEAEAKSTSERLKELEHALAESTDRACIDDDTARRLRKL